jgi:hypothetical protein
MMLWHPGWLAFLQPGAGLLAAVSLVAIMNVKALSNTVATSAPSATFYQTSLTASSSFLALLDSCYHLLFLTRQLRSLGGDTANSSDIVLLREV